MDSNSEQIRQLARTFAEQIVKLTQSAIVDAFHGKGTSVAITNGATAAVTAAKAAPGPIAKRSKGGKRTAAELEALKERLVRLIADNPGARVEQVNGLLGTKTADIAGPLRQLVAAKVIKTEGQRRGTRYLPGKKA